MDRREFVKNLAIGTGCIVLLPAVTACGGSAPAVKTDPVDVEPPVDPKAAEQMATESVPMVPPPGWDPIEYNKARGLAGKIPESYHASITGPDGATNHLGKHLPYVPSDIPAEMALAGFIPIMWGDPEKGCAKHPNAAKSEENPEGHWYNWIRVRKAVAGEAEELESSYQSWPDIGEGSNGQYAAHGGGDVTADGGKNTIYLAALPNDVKPGDTVRIHAHCLTHGEYVDFITL